MTKFKFVETKIMKNKKRARYMAFGMTFGMLAGSVAMSILTIFGLIAWGGLAIGLGTIIGMLVGLLLAKE